MEVPPILWNYLICTMCAVDTTYTAGNMYIVVTINTAGTTGTAGTTDNI